MRSMRTKELWFLAWAIVIVPARGALAQQAVADSKAATAPATYTGCVMQSAKVASIYLLATSDRCLMLNGKYDPAKAAGHETTFKGILSEAEGNLPPSLKVQSTVQIKATCSHTCTPPAPAHRGLGYQTTDPQQGDSNAKPSQFPKPGPHQ